MGKFCILLSDVFLLKCFALYQATPLSHHPVLVMTFWVVVVVREMLK
jgi:hypothetical protein